VATKFSFGNFKRPFKPKQAPARSPPDTDRHAIYRGYDLELKSMMVGWQVTVVKNDSIVCNTDVTVTREAALVDAHAHIDRLLQHAETLAIK
jgi:hypothetical protein